MISTKEKGDFGILGFAIPRVCQDPVLKWWPSGLGEGLPVTPTIRDIVAVLYFCSSSIEMDIDNGRPCLRDGGPTAANSLAHNPLYGSPSIRSGSALDRDKGRHFDDDIMAWPTESLN